MMRKCSSLQLLRPDGDLRQAARSCAAGSAPSRVSVLRAQERREFAPAVLRRTIGLSMQPLAMKQEMEPLNIVEVSEGRSIASEAALEALLMTLLEPIQRWRGRLCLSSIFKT